MLVVLSLPPFFIVAAIALALLYPAQNDLGIKRLKRRSRRFRLSRICGLLETCLTGKDDKECWIKSERLKGSLMRMIVAIEWMLVARALYQRRRIALATLLRTASPAALEAWFSMLGIPEALLCVLIPGMPHIANRTAMAYHAELLIRVSVLWAETDNGSSTPNIDFLL